MALVEEEFAEPGMASNKKRVRNHGEHPMTLAFHRGQLESKYPADVPERDRITAKERLAAGEEYRRSWENVYRTGRDSLDMIVGGGGNGAGRVDTKAVARDWLKRIHARMHPKDITIIQAFCGERRSMPDALRSARIIPHPDGAAWRIREALDDLVAATTGRRIIPTTLNMP